MIAFVHNTRSMTFLRLASFLGLLALLLIVWSVLDPRPIPVFLGMSVAQGIGTLSFAMFGWTILRDLVRSGVLSKKPRTAAASSKESPAAPAAPAAGLKTSEV